MALHSSRHAMVCELLRIFDRGHWWVCSLAKTGEVLVFHAQLRDRGGLMAHVNRDGVTWSVALVWDGKAYCGDRVTWRDIGSIIRRC